MGRRSVLRLLGVATVGLVAACRSGNPKTAPASAGPATTPPAGSPQARPTSAAPTKAPSPSPEPTISPPSADQLLARRVALAEQALLAAYDAAAAAHPELAGRLAPFRADHVAHLRGLVPGDTPQSPTATAPSPTATAPSPTDTAHSPTDTAHSPTNTAPTSASAPPLSSPPSAQIFQQLAQVERDAAAARVNDVATTSGSLARLIASIGGCEAAHAALLSVAT
jgi:hypothetical protein